PHSVTPPAAVTAACPYTTLFRSEAVNPRTGKAMGKLLRRHARGFFEGLISRGKTVPRYRLRFTRESDVWEEEDPYRFPSTLGDLDRKSTRLNSSHVKISYAVFCL